VYGSTTSTDFPLRSQFQGDQPDYDTFLTRLAEPEPEQPGQQKPAPGTSQTQADDVTAPETTIGKRPKKKVKTGKKRARVAFGFFSSESGSRFECALDNGAFAACASPQSYRVKAKFKLRRHSLRVRAIDAAGNADASPAEARFKLKRKRPRV
jgi:hypothetical protein